MKSQEEKAQALLDAAIEAEEAGQTKKALRLYHRAATIYGNPNIPLFRLASLLYDEGEWQEALKAARQVIKGWPDSDITYSLIGECYIEQGQLRRAERAFRQSLAIKANPGTWVFLSYVLMRLDRDDESMDCLRAALKLDPNYEEAHYNLGYEYRLRKKYARAEKHLRRAIEIDPRYALAYAELGCVLLHNKNKTKDASRLLRKSVRLDPNNRWSRAYLGNALWRLRRLKAADEQYRKLIEIWPDNSLSYWCYGGFLACESDDTSLAESYLRKAVELDPKDPAANYELGKNLLYWERKDEAIKYLKKAARLGHDKAKKLLQDQQS
ncbi:MAG: tetratricopeptide repeat protein [Acidobacteriota bacterium]